MKAIIMYYSRKGKVEKLAERVKKDLPNSDILKVEPEKPYGNYIASCIRVIKERKNNIIPKAITKIPDLSVYDVILIGYPVWASDMPAFVSEFLSRCDLKEKKVIPFATFGGSEIDCTMKTLQRVCNEAEVTLPFNYGMSKKDNYEDWMSSIRKIA